MKRLGLVIVLAGVVFAAWPVKVFGCPDGGCCNEDGGLTDGGLTDGGDTFDSALGDVDGRDDVADAQSASSSDSGSDSETSEEVVDCNPLDFGPLGCPWPPGCMETDALGCDGVRVCHDETSALWWEGPELAVTCDRLETAYECLRRASKAICPQIYEAEPAGCNCAFVGQPPASRWGLALLLVVLFVTFRQLMRRA